MLCIYITYIKLCLNGEWAAFLIFPSVLWLLTLHLEKTEGPETSKEGAGGKAFLIEAAVFGACSHVLRVIYSFVVSGTKLSYHPWLILR